MMLSYELCKQLAEAGLKITDSDSGGSSYKYYKKEEYTGVFELSTYDNCCNKGMEEDTDVYIPTLSELIEAVIPDKADTHSFRLQLENNMWECAIHYSDSYSGSVTEFTPEEAVAKLWLELNKKV